MEYDADIVPVTPEPCMYETVYLTAHKAPCRAAAFSGDGKIIKFFFNIKFFSGALVATASEDCSIKILDVEKIISRYFYPIKFFNFSGDASIIDGGPDSNHPVIRTLYDHIDVN